MRKCLFCSNSANSLEDVWPHWITDQFKTSQPSEAQLERHGEKTRSWRVRQPELPIRYVCQPCNNGWMSQIESQTKPFLQPLLMGERQSLDMASQSTIALWSLKTAMVLEALDQPLQYTYTQLERDQIRTLSVIPWRTSVWLAASVDPFLFLSSKHKGAENVNGIPGMTITLACAHIVIQVLTIRIPLNIGPTTHVTTNVHRGPWDQITVQIWPIQTAHVNWPPPLGLNSEIGINALAERFSTASLDKNDVDLLAI